MENFVFPTKQESIETQNIDWGFKPNFDFRVDTLKFSANEWDFKNNFGSSNLEIKNSDGAFKNESNPTKNIKTEFNNNEWAFQKQSSQDLKKQNEFTKENLIKPEKIKEEINNKINKYKKMIDFSIYFNSNNLIADAKFFDNLHNKLINNNLKEKAILVNEQGKVIFLF